MTPTRTIGILIAILTGCTRVAAGATPRLEEFDLLAERADHISATASRGGTIAPGQSFTGELLGERFVGLETTLAAGVITHFAVEAPGSDPVINVYGPFVESWAKAQLVGQADYRSDGVEGVSVEGGEGGRFLVVVWDLHRGYGPLTVTAALELTTAQDGGSSFHDAGVGRDAHSPQNDAASDGNAPDARFAGEICLEAAMPTGGVCNASELMCVLTRTCVASEGCDACMTQSYFACAAAPGERCEQELHAYACCVLAGSVCTLEDDAVRACMTLHDDVANRCTDAATVHCRAPAVP